ncbi:carboxyl transferase domain-containing protein [Pseudonocardia sp. NPDC049635]|uniref:acyl-CoA carboxylase subunit beta n=1 Tax=Pseudonocardia sp. NPDC049635 TaxID=3155506 RepID=UPI0033FCBA7B
MTHTLPIGHDGRPPDTSRPRPADDRCPRRRLSLLFDHSGGSDADSSGVAVARGPVHGRPVHAFCIDPGVRGGALSRAGCARIVGVVEAASREGVPVVGLWHSGGARIDEGVDALDGVGSVFRAMVRASGVVPQISVVLGPAAGGAAYGPALTDVVVMSDEARMFVTGPEVIRQVTGEQIGMRELGGPDVHHEMSGVAHVRARDDDAAVGAARQLAALLRTPGRDEPSAPEDRPALRRVLPERAVRAYDVGPLLRLLLDDDGIELQSDRAPNIVTRLGRLGGRRVGVVANNPIRLGGCLTAAASEKAARFVRMCDAFGVPVVAVVDVPGYLPGPAEEHGGVLRHGAKLLHAFAGATTPRITLVTRKAFGGAYLAMNARSMGADAVFAWPGAEIAVMGAEAAVGVLHRRALAALSEEEAAARRAELVTGQRTATSLDRLVAHGHVDRVIDPAETPARIAEALDSAAGGRSDQRNIPL